MNAVPIDPFFNGGCVFHRRTCSAPCKSRSSAECIGRDKKRLSLPSRFPSSPPFLSAPELPLSPCPLRVLCVSRIPGRCIGRILRGAAGNSGTGGWELGYRRPGILFPTGRESCSRLPGDVLCPPVRFFPAVLLPPEKWPPSLKGRAVLCPLSEFYCNFARTTHLR